MNKFTRILIVCLSMSLICSCRAEDNNKQIPNVSIPSTEINKVLNIEANQVSPNDEIIKNLRLLQIQNQSNETIGLKDNFITIYYWENGEWVLIQNKVTYPNYDYSLSPEGEPADHLFFDVLPIPPGIEEPTLATIVVIGYTKSSNEQVVGTIEVTIYP
jgi:hypothetical protein